MFQEKERRVVFGGKSRYCDKVAMRKDLWEKGDMPVFLGS